MLSFFSCIFSHFYILSFSYYQNLWNSHVYSTVLFCKIFSTLLPPPHSTYSYIPETNYLGVLILPYMPGPAAVPSWCSALIKWDNETISFLWQSIVNLCIWLLLSPYLYFFFSSYSLNLMWILPKDLPTLCSLLSLIIHCPHKIIQA